MGAHVNDRTVHAVMSDGSQLVRYDKAGKWYQEWLGPHPRRLAMTLGEVVTEAVEAVLVFYDQPGGGSFDKRLKAALAEVTVEPNG